MFESASIWFPLFDNSLEVSRKDVILISINYGIVGGSINAIEYKILYPSFEVQFVFTVIYFFLEETVKVTGKDDLVPDELGLFKFASQLSLGSEVNPPRLPDPAEAKLVRDCLQTEDSMFWRRKFGRLHYNRRKIISAKR